MFSSRFGNPYIDAMSGLKLFRSDCYIDVTECKTRINILQEMSKIDTYHFSLNIKGRIGCLEIDKCKEQVFVNR